MKRIEDDDLVSGIGSNLNANEADLLDQEEVAVTDEVLEDEMDSEREEYE